MRRRARPAPVTDDFRELLEEKFKGVYEKLDTAKKAIEHQDTERETQFAALERRINVRLDALAAAVAKRDGQLKAIGTVSGVVGTFLGLALNWVRLKLGIWTGGKVGA